MAKEFVKLLEQFKQEMKAEMKELKECLEREIRKEMREMKLGMDYMNEKFEEMKVAFQSAISDNKELRKEHEVLKQECEDLRKRLKENDSRITHCEQYSRRCNLEIKGVPGRAGEGTSEIVKKIGSLLQEEINDNDLEACHRVPVLGSPEMSNIVVQFAHVAKRNAVLEKARKKRLNCGDLDLASGGAIYINEHLCPTLKRLFGATVSKKKQCGWRYAWTRNGKIFARKTELSKVVQIACTDDLSDIVP